MGLNKVDFLKVFRCICLEQIQHKNGITIMNHVTFADREVEALVRTGLYKSREEVISDAIRNLLLNNKSLRLELAIDLFRSDEVSLGRAAEVAGVDRWQFQDILKEHQIPIIIEAESAEEMDRDIALFFGK
jgi:predicted HTH domain antitoxin